MSIIVLYFIIGACVGSFLNVVILRLHKKEQFIKGRSKCFNCGHILNKLDLIPIASFLFLNGKCRYCGFKLSLQYLIIEILTGILFAFLFIANYELLITNYELLFLLFLGSLLIILFIYDLRYKLVPHEIIWPAVAGVIFYKIIPFLIFNFQFSIFNSLYYDFMSAIFATAFIAFIVVITRQKGMGWGDVPLTFIITFIPSFPYNLFVFWLSFIIGGIVGIIMLILRKVKLKTEVPFGPFLIGALALSVMLNYFNINLFWWNIF